VQEGGPVTVNNMRVPQLGAAMITNEKGINVAADDAELLLVDVKL
jgi:hypothetical protein